MSRLVPLSTEVTTIFEKCISDVKDKELKARYKSCMEEIMLDSKEYEDRMKENTANELDQKSQLGAVTKQEMINVYDYRFVKRQGRKYYDEIFMLPEHGICPYCGQGKVETLDHFFPKTKYISLVVTPSNLVPSCNACNKSKAAEQFCKIEDMPINPYFTDLHSFVWLDAKIIKDTGTDFTISFYVNESQCADTVIYKRLLRLFEMCNFNKLYISHAGQDLPEVKGQLVRLYMKYGGKNAVLDELKERIDQSGYPLNHWKKAMYRTLMTDKWFLDEWLPLRAKYLRD